MEKNLILNHAKIKNVSFFDYYGVLLLFAFRTSSFCATENFLLNNILDRQKVKWLYV